MITHILKDGTVLKDITGHKVTKEEAPTVYKILERITEEESNGHLRGSEESK